MNRKKKNNLCFSAASLALQSKPCLSNNAATQSCDGSNCKRMAASRGSSDSVFLQKWSLGQFRHVIAAPLNLRNQSVQNGPLCFQWNHLPVWIEHQALKESSSCTFQSVHRIWRTKTAQKGSYQTTASMSYTWKETFLQKVNNILHLHNNFSKRLTKLILRRGNLIWSLITIFGFCSVLHQNLRGWKV